MSQRFHNKLPPVIVDLSVCDKTWVIEENESFCMCVVYCPIVRMNAAFQKAFRSLDIINFKLQVCCQF